MEKHRSFHYCPLASIGLLLKHKGAMIYLLIYGSSSMWRGGCDEVTARSIHHHDPYSVQSCRFNLCNVVSFRLSR